MNSLNLEEGTIMHEGQWVTAGDLAERIQNQINEKNMKFASLAASLETLNTALENSQQVEVKIVLPKDMYEKLKAKGGEDDKESIKKAIISYVGINGSRSKKNGKAAEDGKTRFKDHFLG
jgi:hypothetical protein